MKIKHNILIYPKANRGDLIAQINYESKRIDVSVGISAKGCKWSADTQRVKASGFNHKGISGYDVNLHIEHFLQVVEDVFDFFSSKNYTPSQQELREEIKDRIKGKKKDNYNIIYVLNEYINETQRLHSWSNGTLKRWNVTKNHLTEWNGCNELNDFDSIKFNQYIKYLIDCEYNNTYIRREIKYIKTFIRWCIKRKIYEGDAIDVDARMKVVDNDIVFLTWEELMKVYNLDLSNRPHIAIARDVFCFQCFTGLRYSDVSTLKWSNIYDGAIHITTQKTSSSLEIELNKYALAILDKYKQNDDKIFNCASNQKTNDALKVVGKLAELDTIITKVSYNGGNRTEKAYKKHELMTTHCGRRTFVCNALYLGIPEVVVRSWTGHTTSQSLKPYLKIVDELKKNEMDKFNEK